jgi:hypothetical protein
MNNFPSKAAIDARKARYTPGARVELVRCDDPYTKITPGTKGTVEMVDDCGTVFVKFDSGSTLGMVFEHDEIRKLTVIPNEVVEEILAVRQLPNCPNMFDARAVQRLAYDNEFYALVNFIEGNLKAYGRFIFTGQREV